MAYEIVMPQLSDSMTEGKLVSWKVKPGDAVKSGDIIAEVESDKAIMEVQTFRDGIVKELKVQEGQSVPVGSVIAVIDEEGAKGKVQPSNEKPKPKPAVSSEPSKNTSSSKPNVQESTTEKTIVDELFANEKAPSGSSSERSIRHSESKIQNLSEGTASPKARALAARYGFDLEKLQKRGELPTPAHAEDVERYHQRKYFTPKAWKLLEAYHLDPALFESGKKHDEAEIESYIQSHEIPLPKPLSSNQKAVIATVEQAAKKPVYHIYDHIDASLITQHESPELTVTVWLLKLLSETMMRHEALRSTLGPQGIQVWPNASISLAMAKGEELYMPVLKDLNKKSPGEIAKELKAMKEKVKAGRLTPEDIRGSTFGLSNLGMTGIERFDAMINESDSGIIAVGTTIDGKIAVTFTLDHRLVNGWQGAQAMETLKALAKDEMTFKEHA